MDLHVHVHRARDAAGELEKQAVYASMPLSSVSQEALAQWARKRGVLSAEVGMHVTTAYTKAPVEVPGSYRRNTRDNAAGLVIPSGGRRVELFGDRHLVLCVDCPELQERHLAWRARGATWDYPDYQPHITFADLKWNAGARIDMRGEPFDEPITLLPEIVSRPRTSY